MIDPSPRTGRAARDSTTGPGSRSAAASITFPDLAQLVRIAQPAPPDLADVRFAVRRCRAGQPLVRNGDPFRSMYAVRHGVFKQVAMNAGGAEQVVAFPMAGDVIGADGIDAGVHHADITALSEAEVAILPLAQLNRVGREFPGAGLLLSRIFGKELSRALEGMWMLGILSATARVALFLDRLSARLGSGGAPRLAFDLPMTRAEIASFLGLSVETVSRVLGALAGTGIIEVDHRRIVIRDAAGLKAVVERSETDPPSRRTEPEAQSRRAAPVRKPRA
ncbi:MAG: Crp/Fnr family transcriptional regulator [Burkholderiales bacterium]|nr:Crp/Fnr family transcriptional regulator [Burkholderiales bacterium]